MKPGSGNNNKLPQNLNLRLGQRAIRANDPRLIGGDIGDDVRRGRRHAMPELHIHFPNPAVGNPFAQNFNDFLQEQALMHRPRGRRNDGEERAEQAVNQPALNNPQVVNAAAANNAEEIVVDEPRQQTRAERAEAEHLRRLQEARNRRNNNNSRS